MSFVNLVNRKYFQTQQKLTSGVEIKVNKEIPMSDLTVVSLKCLLLESAGPPGEIQQHCPKIQELDISETNIINWQEVIQIVSQLPDLSFLDLTRLRFDLDSFQEKGQFKHLKVLVMGRSNLPPSSLHLISFTFPDLTSLELRGSVLSLSETFSNNAFSSIVKLNLAFCKISDFSDVLSLSKYLSLAELKLCNNPIRSVSYNGGFLSLKKINIEGSHLNELGSVSTLNLFPVLTEVRLGNCPLAERLGHHFRKILISYLPKITKINGGFVEAKERNFNERQFIRDFSDPGNSSAHVKDNEYLFKLVGFVLMESEEKCNELTFLRLLDKHGTVCKFADVNLAPPTTANLLFETEDGRTEQKEVPLGWTVGNLKKLCQGLFGIPEKRQKLYYLDSEVPMLGIDLLRFDNKVLRTIKMKDNDLIKVVEKS